MNNQQNGENARHRSSTTRAQEFTSIRPNLQSQGPQKSLKERIKESFVAVLIGLALFICGIVLLFWNEGNAVYTAKSLDEGYNSVIEVPASEFIEKSNEGKLVHVWGTLSVITPLQDTFYGIRVKAVSLKRRVQTYQWVEEDSSISSSEQPDASDSSYSYSQAWRDKLVDSSSFYIPWGHENPKSAPIPSLIQTAEIVKVGSYHLSPAIKDTFQKFIAFSGDEQPDVEEIKLHNGMYYLTKDIFNPETGDIRIQFYFAGHDGEAVTLIAKQSGNFLHPYVTSSGKELLIVRPGKLSIEEMFSSEHAQNRLMTWMNRLVGWFFLFIGMTAVSHIIQYVVTLSPMLRDVIFLGLGSANMTLSMSLSLLIIGGAWCFYRPGLALFILIVATLPMIRAVARSRDPFSRGAAPRFQAGRV